MSRARARRPEVFVSATSQDLGECRRMVKEGLLTIGCVPVEQSNFPPDARTVREMLRARLSACDAMVHLVGERYGAEPSTRAPGEPRRSYTQLEYDIARELGLPVYVFVCADDFPYPPAEPEPEELRALQQAHRRAVQEDGVVDGVVPTDSALEARVLALESRVEALTEELTRTRSWLGRGVAAGLVLVGGLAGGLWWLGERADRAEAELAAVEAEVEEQRGYIRRAAGAFVDLKAQLDELELTDAELWEQALATAARGSSIPLPEFRASIELFVSSVRQNPEAASMDRALVEFAEGNFALAGDLALESAEESRLKREANRKLLERARQADQELRDEQRAALRLAASSRFSAGDYRAAIEIWDRALDPDVTRKLDEDGRATEWQVIRLNQAIAWNILAREATPAEAAELLARSATALDEAAAFVPREKYPFTWSCIQAERGRSLLIRAEFAEPEERGSMLTRAEERYRAALEVQTPEDEPKEYLRTTGRLAYTLATGSDLLEPDARLPLLEESIRVCRDGLERGDPQANPKHWAWLHHRIGFAYSRIAGLAPESERPDMLARAAEAYRAELEFRREAGLESDAGQSWSNLGRVLGRHGGLASGEERIRLLRESVDAHRRANELYSRDEDPEEWARERRRLATAYDELSQEVGNAERMGLAEDAVRACRTAMEVFTREALPDEWGQTVTRIAHIRSRQADWTDSDAERIQFLKESADGFRVSLEVVDPVEDPPRWSELHMNLAVTLDKLSKEGEEERQEAYLAEAVPAMREALATGQEDPEQRALLETWVDQRERRLWQYGWRRRQALPPRERLAALEPLIAELGPGGYGPMVASLHAQRAGAWASLAGTLEGSEERDAWDRAITARRVVVAAWPRDEFPEKWGNAQVKLGSALRSRGALPGVEDRPRWFGEAAAAFRAAIAVRSREDDAEAWALANNELAATLIPHADFVDPAERPAVLREAVAAMKCCLEVWTAEAKPELHAPRQAWLEQAEAELAEGAAEGG